MLTTQCIADYLKVYEIIKEVNNMSLLRPPCTNNISIPKSEVFTTVNGVKFKTIRSINDKWSDYDKSVAFCQLNNNGIIILDAKHDTPIDNDYDIDDCLAVLFNKN